MERDEILRRVRDLLWRYVGDGVVLDETHGESAVLADLGVNSARLVDIVLDAEDAFGIAVDDAEADGVRSLGDIVAIIVSKEG